MSSDRIKGRRDQAPIKAVRREDGRYVRWSWKYNTWQVNDPTAHTWRNIRPELARCYAASGFPIGVHGGSAI